MADAKKPIVVAGGGIGGLSAAIAVGRDREVTLLEQADRFEPIGYGIQLGPNAFHMFDEIGISDAVLSRSSLPENGQLRDALSGEVFAELPMGAAIQERYGQPYAVIHRGDLHEALLEACAKLDTVTLVNSAQVTGYEEEGETVTVSTSNGETYTAAALLGADGLRSQIRARLVPECKAEKVGYVALRGLLSKADVPQDLAPNSVVLWCGPGFHMIHYPLRGDDLFNVVAVFRVPDGDLPDTSEEIAARLLCAFEQSCPEVHALLQYVDLTQHWEIASIYPIRDWTLGRVALLGDAAHAMVQAMAQGACQAIEDAVAVAGCMRRHGDDMTEAFREYHALRLLRATRVQYMSRYMWELIHVHGAYRELRRDMLRNVSPTDALERLNWLYDRPRGGELN